MLKLNNPIHHIGVATQSIDVEFPLFQKLGFTLEDEFIDENQGVRGLFIKNQSYRLELLENLDDKGPLCNYLKNNTKMYHIAYETQDIYKDLEILRKRDIQGGGALL